MTYPNNSGFWTIMRSFRGWQSFSLVRLENKVATADVRSVSNRAESRKILDLNNRLSKPVIGFVL